MIKCYLCLLLGSGVCAVQAQSPAPARKLPVHFGLRLGLNYSTMNFNEGVPKPAVPVETTWQPGLAVGALVQLELGRKLTLQQEYVFSQLGGALANGGPRYRLQYLALPLLLGYRVLPRLALVAGPQLDLLIKAEEDAGGQTTDITHDTEERGLGATAGLQVQVWRSLGLSARYLQGINHVGIGQRSAVQEFKHQAVQLAAEVRF